jgi:hypothetical protein
MKAREYSRNNDKGNFVKAYPVNAGWEIEISCQGKTLKYGASNCNRTFWNSRKQAVEAVNSIFYKGIAEVYLEEHKRQFGY